MSMFMLTCPENKKCPDNCYRTYTADILREVGEMKNIPLLSDQNMSVEYCVFDYLFEIFISRITILLFTTLRKPERKLSKETMPTLRSKLKLAVTYLV